MSVTSSTGPWAKVPIWVLTIGLKGNELAVYVALSSWADRDRDAHPRVRQIADRAGVSERTAERAIARLRELKALVTTRWMRDDGSIGGCNYTLIDSPPGVTQSPGSDADDTGGTGPRDTRGTGPRDGAKNRPVVQTKEQTPLVKADASTASVPDEQTLFDPPPAPKPRKLKPEDLDDHIDFIAFWRAYPKRVAKGAAKTAWLKAITRTTPSTITTGARAYADYIRITETTIDKIAHPASWLNADRWEDEYTAPTQDRSTKGWVF